MKILVVGSSFAAYGCVLGLLEHAQPLDITVIDGGRELDQSTRTSVEKLHDAEHIDWSADTVRALTGSRYDAAGFPLKTEFSSEYCYSTRQDMHHRLSLQDRRIDLLQTTAAGGFSNLWGGSMLPMHSQEYERWPFAEERLAGHYRSILARVPLAGRHDLLASQYPLYTDQLQDLRRNTADTDLLAEIDPNNTRLQQQGILLGQSRLAIYAGTSENACTHCNHCLHGCPRGALFSTHNAFSDWAAAGRIRYEKGTLMYSFRETDAGVDAVVETDKTGRRETRHYDKVFAGAGALQSARIYLQSYPDRIQHLSLLTARKFLIPCWSAVPDTGIWDTHRLSTPGIFCSVHHEPVSAHTVHMQLSGANAMILQKLGLFPGRPGFRAAALRPLLSRLRVFWAGAHAEHSPVFNLCLQDQILHVSISREPEFNTLQRALLQLLQRNRSLIKLSPIATLVKTAPPGGGAHNGACLPMTRHPVSPAHTDLQGRPSGLSRVHFIDASVFPTIPSTTIALTIMANAHRIATEAFQSDQN